MRRVVAYTRAARVRSRRQTRGGGFISYRPPRYRGWGVRDDDVSESRRLRPVRGGRNFARGTLRRGGGGVNRCRMARRRRRRRRRGNAAQLLRYAAALLRAQGRPAGCRVTRTGARTGRQSATPPPPPRSTRIAIDFPLAPPPPHSTHTRLGALCTSCRAFYAGVNHPRRSRPPGKITTYPLPSPLWRAAGPGQ